MCSARSGRKNWSPGANLKSFMSVLKSCAGEKLFWGVKYLAIGTHLKPEPPARQNFHFIMRYLAFLRKLVGHHFLSAMRSKKRGGAEVQSSSMHVDSSRFGAGLQVILHNILL